jgi:hypothetical protein
MRSYEAIAVGVWLLLIAHEATGSRQQATVRTNRFNQSKFAAENAALSSQNTFFWNELVDEATI